MPKAHAFLLSGVDVDIDTSGHEAYNRINFVEMTKTLPVDYSCQRLGKPRPSYCMYLTHAE